MRHSNSKSDQQMSKKIRNVERGCERGWYISKKVGGGCGKQFGSGLGRVFKKMEWLDKKRWTEECKRSRGSRRGHLRNAPGEDMPFAIGIWTGECTNLGSIPTVQCHNRRARMFYPW
jgi:hypothetical protein